MSWIAYPCWEYYKMKYFSKTYMAIHLDPLKLFVEPKLTTLIGIDLKLKKFKNLKSSVRWATKDRYLKPEKQVLCILELRPSGKNIDLEHFEHWIFRSERSRAQFLILKFRSERSRAEKWSSISIIRKFRAITERSRA